MPSRRPRRPTTDDTIHSWLERSIQRPVYIDRSEGEKLAEEELIHEKAKTERWNRWTVRAWYTAKVGLPLLVLGFLLGVCAAAALG